LLDHPAGHHAADPAVARSGDAQAEGPMRDQMFSGATIEEALAQAARTLGLPRETLRYVVLDPGQPGLRGLSPTPARIAILHDDPEKARAASAAVAEGDDAGPPEGAVPLLLEIMEELEHALDDALGVEVREDEEQGLVVRIEGPGRR